MKKIIMYILIGFVMFSCGQGSNNSVRVNTLRTPVEETQSENSKLTEESQQDEIDESYLHPEPFPEVMPLVEVDLSIFNQQEVLTRQQNSSLISENIDFSASTINYFNPEEIDISRMDLDESTPLSIVDYGPVGDLPEEVTTPSIFILFSVPMVPITNLGEPLTSFPYVNIEPKIEGQFYWYGTNLLSFEPSEPLLQSEEGVSQEYRVTIHEGFPSLTGKVLDEAFSFSFFPEPLKLISIKIPSLIPGEYLWRTSNIPMEEAHKVLLFFNMPVDPETIKEGLSVKKNNREIPFTLTQPQEDNIARSARSLLITIPDSVEFTNSNAIKINIEAGTHAKEGAPSLSEDERKTYRTLSRFSYSGNPQHSYSFPYRPDLNHYPVYISLSQPLAPDQNLADIVTTSLDVDLNGKIDFVGSYIRLTNLPLEAGDEFTVSITSDLKDIYGQNLIEIIDQEIKVPIPNAYVLFPAITDYFTNQGYQQPRRGYLENEFTPRVLIEHLGLTSLSYLAQKLDDGIQRNRGWFIPSGMELNSVNLEDNEPYKSYFEDINLSEFLDENNNGTAQIFSLAEIPNERHPESPRFANDSMVIQSTNVGITVRYGYNRFLVWANTLSKGEPITQADVTLETSYGTKTAVTDEDGLAIIEFTGNQYKSLIADCYDKQFAQIIVKTDTEFAEFEFGNTQNANRSGITNVDTPLEGKASSEHGIIFSDRKLYKPGESLSFRGLDWKLDQGDFSPVYGEYSVHLYSRNNGNEYSLSTDGELSFSGGFYGSFELTGDPAPGEYVLIYYRKVRNNSRSSRSNPYDIVFRASTTIQIANFRRLNFSVSSNVPDRIYYEGDSLSTMVEANYLAGGAMPGAAYSYFWTRNSIQYTPPGSRWESYLFGISVDSPEVVLNQGEGILSAEGKATIQQVATGHVNTAGTYRYVAETTVNDIDNQQVSSTVSTIVHPASFYIGTHLGIEETWWSRFLPSNKESSVSVALVKADGEMYEEGAHVTASLSRYTWKATYQQGVSNRINVGYNRTEEEVSNTLISVDSSGSAIFSIMPETSGQYILRLSSMDKQGKNVITELNFYAYGGSWYFNPGQGDMITLLPDKDQYFVGDTAKILVQSPLPSGRYLLTIEREGIVDEKIITMDEETTTIDIPIEESFVPRMYIALSSFTSREETPENYYDNDLGKPKSLFGVTSIDISTRTREMDIEIVNNQENYRPGEEAEVYIRVSRNGEPVPLAEVIFLAVDRGVIDLVNYHVPNPLEIFYSPENFPLCTRGDDLRNYLLSPVTYEIDNLQGGDGIKMDERNDFNPLACFVPSVLTDENGVAKVNFILPDNLTTYRTTAIALSESAYIGYQEEEILVQNPINVRTAFARKLRYRDTSVGNIILQNNQTEEQEVKISLDSDLINFPGESVKTVLIPAGGTYSVPFLMIPQGEGEAEINITIESAVLNEVITEPMTIERPVTMEFFASSGMANSPIPSSRGFFTEEGVILPSIAVPLTGSLSTEAYTSRMGMLTTPLNCYKDYYLRHGGPLSREMYQYFPDVIFGTTLNELCDNTYSPLLVSGVLDLLKAVQTEQGWISYYEDQDGPYEYSDLAVLHFCILAEDKGISIPSGLREKLQEYLFAVEEWDSSTLSYAAYVFRLAGEDVNPLLDKILEDEDRLGITALSMMVINLKALDRNEEAERLWQKIRNCMHFEARDIYFDEPGRWWCYDSEVRKSSFVAWAATTMGESEEIQRRCIEAVKYKLSNTSNRGERGIIWTFIAMKAYCESDHVDDIDLFASISFNGEEVASKHYTSIRQPSLLYKIDFDQENSADLPENTGLPLRFEKDGTGNLYYSTLLSYALPNEIVLPRNQGIGVYSQYETLEGEKIAPSDLIAGTTYRVRSIISTTKARNSMTLEVPIPSGVELIDPSFVTSSTYANKGGTNSEITTETRRWGESFTYSTDDYYGFYGPYWWYWRNRPSMQYYDNRIIYSWNYFYKGEKEITFLVRATRPGIYPTPAAQAQLDDNPEIFGRTGGLLFVIKDQ